MPTRSYFFPNEFSHIEKILIAEGHGTQTDYMTKFRAAGVAPLRSGLDLAIVLGIGPGLLISILRNQKSHYRRFGIPKGDGTTRLVSSPRTYLKVVQWWILDNILNPLRTSEHAFGFVKGRSIVSNASFHLGSRHFLNVDIKSFFDSVKEWQIAEVFESIGYSPNTSKVLARLCSLDGSLPQGAPTSPAIANQILLSLDNSLSNICAIAGIKYSRYADDLTFSSRFEIHSDFLEVVLNEVTAAGFDLKPQKTRWSGPGGRPEVTGLVVREFVQPPLNWRKRQRSTLHKLKFKTKLEEKDVRYLEGISGYASQFPDAVQMRTLARVAGDLLKASGRSKGTTPDHANP